MLSFKTQTSTSPLVTAGTNQSVEIRVTFRDEFVQYLLNKSKLQCKHNEPVLLFPSRLDFDPI